MSIIQTHEQEQSHTQDGGKVINSGGFGCIFEPSLKCLNSSNKRTSQISKLMKTKYAKYEYNQIQKYNKLLRNIPNYENYFLLHNFQLCKPTKLTKEDLTGFKKCKALKKKGINAKNINKSLDELLAINMPNGGIDIDKFIKINGVNNVSSSIRLNDSLIDLLINGIVPMNNMNVYHCDIKGANVLVKETDFSTRLIDWGLSVVFNETSGGIPHNLYRRPFQFNSPFTTILFNNDFISLYNDFLELNKTPEYFQIREFVINYIFIWNDIRGSGHLSAINNIIKKLTINDLNAVKQSKIKDHLIEYDLTYYYIIEYISQVLHKYTIKGGLDLMTYFEEIFLKNIDIWGFTMIYIILYENLFKTYETLTHYQIEFINKLKYIIIHYLYESPTNIIDVASLAKELTSLNELIQKFNVEQVSNKLKYMVKFKNNIGGFNKTNKNKNKPNKNKTNKNKTNKRRL